jgi:DNA polymerase-4
MLDNPALKGKPVIVGGSKQRGVVSSASYEARRYGIHSAQPVATAMRLCPSGVFLSGRMSRYKDVSKTVFGVFHAFTPLVEPVSIDEAFLDVTGSKRLFGRPEAIAGKIKEEVKRETGLTISAGIAPTKFVAKIASDMNKPDGMTVVPPGDVDSFLAPLSISKMWGVGAKTQEKLRCLGIQTIGDLRRFPVKVLEKRLGKWGLRMHQLASGIDERDVVAPGDSKSVGHERTFAHDLLDVASARKEILFLADKVARRLRRNGLVGKTITLKVKYSDFRQITRSQTLTESSNEGSAIYLTVCRMLDKTDVGDRPVRLLGVSVSQLSDSRSGEQLSLFDSNRRAQKRKELYAALDALADRFGEQSVRPATLIGE